MTGGGKMLLPLGLIFAAALYALHAPGMWWVAYHLVKALVIAL